MRTKAYFFNIGKCIFGNRNFTIFWEDTQLGETPLALKCPSLYNIAQRKEVFVGTVLSFVRLNIQFKRTLVGEQWYRRLHLVRRLMKVNLSDGPDTLHKRLSFRVRCILD